MSTFEGLKSCSHQFNNFCITKSIEFSLSAILFALTFYQLCSRIKRQRQINFFVIVSLLMQVSLLCNMMFCWFHKSYFILDTQIFSFSLYFIAIVYQVALRLVQKSQRIKKVYWAIIHGVFLLYIFANITAFVLRLTDLYTTQLCNEVWVLVLQCLGIVLSICMVAGGLKHQKLEKEKVSGVYKEEHLKNPMPSMWKWITINIGCQVLSLGESLYFEFSPQKKCKFSVNLDVQSSLNLFFDVFSYHVGMFATFWFLRKKYEQAQIIKRVLIDQKQSSLRKDSLGDDTNNIEMVIARFSQTQ